MSRYPRGVNYFRGGLFYPCCLEALGFYVLVEKGTPAIGVKKSLGGVGRDIPVGVCCATVKSDRQNFCRFVVVSISYGGGWGGHEI